MAGRVVPLEWVRHRRARRYILRLRPDGVARVTVPSRGSLREAREFAARHVAWLERQLRRLDARAAEDRRWRAGQPVLFRGEWTPLRLEQTASGWQLCWADQVLAVPGPAEDFRPVLERHLRGLAARELPERVRELAAREALPVQRVTVRDQRTRWGSCSHRGTISLNWRLVLMPPAVRDYVIWHELMHLREMNHSRRFWARVAAVYPDFVRARRWLRQQGEALR